MRLELLVLTLLITHAAPAVGQEPSAPPAESDTVATEVVAESEARGPVPVPEPSEKAMRYYRSGNLLWLVNTIWGLLIPALFLFTGFSARIRDWARGLGRKWFFVIGVYLIIFAAINFVIDFPLDLYQGYIRQHAYDLSNQTFGKWFGDALKSLMVGLVIAVLFVWVPYFLLRKSPRRWWLYTSLAAVPCLFFLLMVSPIWIDPLFNDFGPMQDEALETRILTLAERAGIQGGRVFEVNKSVDTEAVNAYVTGFLGTKRIVLWDTIIRKLESDELLFVMGHEMGHYVLNHAIKLVFFFSLLILVGLYLIHRTGDAIIARFRERFRFDQLSDIASFPLLILLFNLYALVIVPIALGYTRRMEHEADRFGLEVTQDNYHAATAFVKLQAENLGNPRPGPLYKLWRASHPTLGERIGFCNAYRPWENDEPLKYGELLGTR